MAVDDNVEPAWDITRGNPFLTVAVLDDGVDEATPDLAGRVSEGWDAFNPDTGEFAPITCVADCMLKPLSSDPHGTAVAGIIAAMQDNPSDSDFNLKEGISGIAPNVFIYPVRIFRTAVPGSRPEAASCEKTAEGIDFAWDVGNAQVINNSWSGGSPCDAITQAINRATTLGRNGLGAVVVFSVGDDSHRSQGIIAPVPWPATLPNVIAVSAIDRTGGIPDYVPQGRIDLVAPSSHLVASGVPSFCRGPGDVVTTDLTGSAGCNDGPNGALNYTSHFDGTSAAAPQVSGAAALLLSSEPSLTWSQVRDRLRDTADPWGATNTFGIGKLNIGRALNPPPPPPPCVPPPGQLRCVS